MSFNIIPLESFIKQIERLDKKSRKLIDSKIDLLKTNPYRYKRLHSKKFKKVFRIRLNINKKETRLIYLVLEPNIILVCLLERKKGYKELEKILNKI